MPDTGVERPAGPAMVHVVDDDDAVRRALTLLLHAAGFGVTAYASGPALLAALAPGCRDCVLTDVRMPGMDGIALLHHLREAEFAGPVIVMTAHGDIAMAVKAMKAGAADFIEKPFDDNTLINAIGAVLPRPNLAGLGAAASDEARQDAVRRVSLLSPREREVLDLLVAGKPNKVIAYELGVSPRTIEIHRARMMARLGVRSLAEAVRLAVRAELPA
jgi:two-component system response regulator FixJ